MQKSKTFFASPFDLLVCPFRTNKQGKEGEEAK
jgi:hypothetical protein